MNQKQIECFKKRRKYLVDMIKADIKDFVEDFVDYNKLTPAECKINECEMIDFFIEIHNIDKEKCIRFLDQLKG